MTRRTPVGHDPRVRSRYHEHPRDLESVEEHPQTEGDEDDVRPKDSGLDGVDRDPRTVEEDVDPTAVRYGRLPE